MNRLSSASTHLNGSKREPSDFGKRSAPEYEWRMSGSKNTLSRSVFAVNHSSRLTSFSSGCTTGSKNWNQFCSGW